jgi:competence protein ComEA
VVYNQLDAVLAGGKVMMRRAFPFLSGLLIGLLAAGLLLLLTRRPCGQPVALRPPPTPGPLRIHVAGHVVRPGLIELPRGAVAADALAKAGGPAADADLDAFNLAAGLNDGQRLHIPGIGETPPAVSLLSGEEHELLDINSATAADLEQLPGIGPSLAKEIEAYRQAHGPFTRLDDLLNVSGIGPAKLSQISDLIVVREIAAQATGRAYQCFNAVLDSPARL